MSKPKWNKGAPPSIGWWPASWSKSMDSLRYWDGECWSLVMKPWEGEVLAGEKGKTAAHDQGKIEWTERWWL